MLSTEREGNPAGIFVESRCDPRYGTGAVAHWAQHRDALKGYGISASGTKDNLICCQGVIGGVGKRGADKQTERSASKPEALVASEQSRRAIRRLVNAALEQLSPEFDPVPI